MEREGVGFQSFFDAIKKNVTNGVIPLGGLLKHLESSYPTVSLNDRSFLVKECIRDRTKVDFVSFEELFTKFAKNLLSSTTQTFQAIASNIQIKMGAAPAESLRQFFKASDYNELDVLSIIDF